MPDPAEQLQRIYLAGFELQTFDRFPKCIGVVRDSCIALLVPSVGGLQMLGTPERLEALRSFRADLQTILDAKP